jgi:hypothetical protein
VLRPGFEPGSAAREAVILNRTILPEPELVYSFSFQVYSHFVFVVCMCPTEIRAVWLLNTFYQFLSLA